MSCRRRRGYRRFSTSAYRLLGDFEVAINGGVWVATGAWRRSAPNSLNIEPQSTRRTPRKSKNNFEMLRVFADAIDIRTPVATQTPPLMATSKSPSRR